MISSCWTITLIVKDNIVLHPEDMYSNISFIISHMIIPILSSSHMIIYMLASSQKITYTVYYCTIQPDADTRCLGHDSMQPDDNFKVNIIIQPGMVSSRVNDSFII